MGRLVMLLALALVVVAPAAQACTNCAAYGASPVYLPGSNKCPTCIRGGRPECGARASKPLCCGGETGIVCPSFACTTSTSTAYSGPLGCARARSTMIATAISDTDFEPLYLCKESIKSYCVDKPADEYLAAYASKAVEVYSKAVALAVSTYSGYVCSCVACKGCYNAGAYTEVSSDIQAVAKATAHALAEAMALVNSECGEAYDVAYAYAMSEAIAEATELAVDYVYKNASASGTKCKEICKTVDIEYAVARAVACAYVDVLAKARDALNPDISYSCSSTYAVSGSYLDGKTWTQTCKGKNQCP